MKALRDPLLWLVALFIALLLVLPHSAPLFSWLFPELPRPVYQQESFLALTLAHFWLVALSSLVATVIGIGAGVIVTRPAGRVSSTGGDHCRHGTDISAGGGTGDCGTGDGLRLATGAYRAGAVRNIARAAGDVGWIKFDIAWGIEHCRGDGDERLAAVVQSGAAAGGPVMLAGIRTSAIVNIGTATIASTVGANTLGTPIIIGLSGFNTAYVLQGALLVALAAIIIDRFFERLNQWVSRHHREQ